MPWPQKSANVRKLKAKCCFSNDDEKLVKETAETIIRSAIET